MKSNSILSILMSFAVLFVGCKPSQVPTAKSQESKRIHEYSANKGTLLISQFDPSQSQALIAIDSLGSIKVLAGQAINVGSKVSSSSDSLNAKRINSVSIQNGIGQLNCHEALYRLSEAYFNGIVDSTKYVWLYDKLLAQPAELLDLEIELQEAKTAALMAEVEKAKVELQKAQLEFEKMKFERNNILSVPVQADSLKEIK